jgi:DNA-binding transcriptional LysR family regulator
MDLRQLEMFLAVVQEGGFNKAASKLYVSQSAISRKISLLEEELNVKLFLRVGNQVTITHAGEALLRHARFIFRQLKAAAVEVSDIGQLHRGEVSIGAGMTACIYLLPPAIREFRQKYPQVEVKITTGTTSELLPQIKEGVIDLGILTLPVVGNNLLVTPLKSEELGIVVSTDHPWSRRKYVEARELTDFPFIMYTKQTHMRSIVDEMFQAFGIVPQVAMELDNFAIIKPLVGINLCISILPFSSITDEIKRKQLHILRIRGTQLKRELALVHLNAEFLPRAVSEMIKFLQIAHGAQAA